MVARGSFWLGGLVLELNYFELWLRDGLLNSTPHLPNIILNNPFQVFYPALSPGIGGNGPSGSINTPAYKTHRPSVMGLIISHFLSLEAVYVGEILLQIYLAEEIKTSLDDATVGR